MSKLWIRAIVSLVITLFCWFMEIIINPYGLEGVWGIGAVVTSILCVCFFAIAIIKHIKSDVSAYKIFAWTDGIIGVCVLAYAIYDILTDTGWFAGLLGLLLIIFVIPVILLLLIIDFVLYIINKKRKHKVDA